MSLSSFFPTLSLTHLPGFPRTKTWDPTINEGEEFKRWWCFYWWQLTRKRWKRCFRWWVMLFECFLDSKKRRWGCRCSSVDRRTDRGGVGLMKKTFCRFHETKNCSTLKRIISYKYWDVKKFKGRIPSLNAKRVSMISSLNMHKLNEGIKIVVVTII